jgi:hypothetical protein
MRRVWSGVLLLLAGCFGSSEVAVQPGLDVESGPLRCEGVPLAEVVGELCRRGSSDCGAGSDCVLDAWSGESRCRQHCVVGVCEQGCGVGEVCDEPWSPEGADLGRLDLNGDGVSESPLAVCGRPQTEAAGTFEMCGNDAALALNRGCSDAALCARFFEVSVAGTCLPACDGDCAAVDGYVPSCFDVGDSVRRCLLECSDELYSSDCPRGMVCRPVQEGFALCVR